MILMLKFSTPVQGHSWRGPTQRVESGSSPTSRETSRCRNFVKPLSVFSCPSPPTQQCTNPQLCLPWSTRASHPRLPLGQGKMRKPAKSRSLTTTFTSRRANPLRRMAADSVFRQVSTPSQLLTNSTLSTICHQTSGATCSKLQLRGHFGSCDFDGCLYYEADANSDTGGDDNEYITGLYDMFEVFATKKDSRTSMTSAAPPLRPSFPPHTTATSSSPATTLSAFQTAAPARRGASIRPSLRAKPSRSNSCLTRSHPPTSSPLAHLPAGRRSSLSAFASKWALSNKWPMTLRT
ncbi:hypothetical protein EDB85DRAFT_2008333 [Lactarius pseudohatsudake]|nr:hypothetical protein EDB85DRAFT_2008333 [Lactarius pseudohatsudake]